MGNRMLKPKSSYSGNLALDSIIETGAIFFQTLYSVFYPSAKKPKGYCNDHRVCLCLSTLHTFRTTGRNSSRILTKLGMMIGYGSGMMPIVGLSGPVITTVLVH